MYPSGHQRTRAVGVKNRPTGENTRMQAILIGNARSSHSRLFMDAHARLVARGVAIDETHIAAHARDARRQVKRAIRAGSKLIIVGGGDGTMTQVGAFAHTEATLGILPLGTGNSFARSLGIEPELDAAIETIVNGACERVDLGRVNDIYFANFSTLGLSAEISGATPERLKGALGAAAYAVAGLRPLLLHKPFACRIRWGKNRLDLRTHQIIVANGRFFGNTPILPDATIDDGELALFTTTGTSRWDVAKSFVAMFAGKQIDLRDAHYLSARKITIKTSPRVVLAIDGDIVGRTPARFSVARHALRVMVPQPMA
jgi:diacylglycerol kinase (ATP)